MRKLAFHYGMLSFGLAPYWIIFSNGLVFQDQTHGRKKIETSVEHFPTIATVAGSI
jgi:hypothetical protein